MSTMAVSRMTMQTLSVLVVFLEDSAVDWYGLDLAERTKLKSGTLYPMLARLESRGWLQSRWEDVDPRVVGRPRRRLYSLTALGEQVTRDELDAHLAALTPRSGLMRRPTPGLRTR
jgi:PadR family transcriptional regulator PadR